MAAAVQPPTLGVGNMDLTPYWREFWRYIEFSYYQLWDFVAEEVVDHPILTMAIALILVVVFAWRLKGRH